MSGKWPSAENFERQERKDVEKNPEPLRARACTEGGSSGVGKGGAGGFPHEGEGESRPAARTKQNGRELYRARTKFRGMNGRGADWTGANVSG